MLLVSRSKREKRNGDWYLETNTREREREKSSTVSSPRASIRTSKACGSRTSCRAELRDIHLLGRGSVGRALPSSGDVDPMFRCERDPRAPVVYYRACEPWRNSLARVVRCSSCSSHIRRTLVALVYNWQRQRHDLGTRARKRTNVLVETQFSFFGRVQTGPEGGEGVVAAASHLPEEVNRAERDIFALFQTFPGVLFFLNVQRG